MVNAKNDILAANVPGAPNVEVFADGSRKITINSSEVYGSGIVRGSTNVQNLTGVTAYVELVDGKWRVITMFPGA